jgi:hypothetical protein
MIKICVICRKKFEVIPSKKTQKLCNKKCWIEYMKKNNLFSKAGKLGGRKGAEYCKKHKIGIFGITRNQRIKVGKYCKEYKKGIFRMTKNQHIEAGRQGAEVNRKNKSGAFFNRQIQSKLGKRCKKLHPNQLSEMGHKGGRKTAKLYPRLASERGKKTAKLHPELASKRGSISIQKRNREKSIKWNGIYFYSKSERDIGININYQFEKLKEGFNYQVAVSNYLFDFLIHKYKCFIEYHPEIKFFDDKTTLEYYEHRREILNQNGYNSYGLTIIE